MQKYNFIVVATAMLMACSNIFGQRAADWTTELPGAANTIFFHSLTGVPIIKGDDYYAGIDVLTHAVKWKINRSKTQALSAKLGQDDELDFFEVANSAYVVVNHTMVDSRDGKIILDREVDAYKKIVEYELIPSLDAILVRTEADGFVRLHLIDGKSGNKKWSSNVLKASGSGLSKMMGAARPENAPPPPVVVPTGTTVVLQENQWIIFQYKGEVAMLKVADGSVSWTSDLEPARIFFSDDQKTAYFVEHSKGGLIAQALSAGKRMGNEITALDVASGVAKWKNPLEAEENIKWYSLEGSKLLIVHAKGCNFFSVDDGKPIWKNDFEARNIKDIQDNADGHLVIYGYNKTMQIDANGKKLWKKPQSLPSEFEEDDIDEDSDFAIYKYEKGALFLYADHFYFSPKKGSGLKRYKLNINPESKLEYDEKRKTMLVYNKDDIWLLNPDKYPKGYIAKDTKTNVSEIQFVEIRNDSYYFAGLEDFVIAKPEGDVVERHYKEPFDKKAFMTNALSTGLALGGAAMAVSGTTKTMKGAAEMTQGVVTNDENTTTRGGKNANKGVNQMVAGNTMLEAASLIPPGRRSAFSQTQDFAYFFTKDKKSGDKVLVQVNKDNGTEVDKFIFNDARPVYKVDEVENRVIYADKKMLMVFEPKK
jgi:outer membrane protein assembly factor BamB